MEEEISLEMLDEMVNDFIRRSKIRYSAEQVYEVMARSKTLILRDGFMSLDIGRDECHVLFMYIRPGAKLLPYFEFAVEDIARHLGCKVIRFLSRRTPEAIMRTRSGYKPVSIMYEKELR